MTLDKWINDYCEENDIELPENIADNKTALRFLQLKTVSGGGGDSDFSIAEVTINNELQFNYNLPYLTEYGGIEYIQCYNSLSGTFNVVLYKGNAVLSFVDEVSVVYTGNVTVLTEGFVYLITGDATFTVTSI